jgi:hypothetical protein
VAVTTVELFKLTGETWLDLTVNLIPIGILIGMEILFFAVNPWGWDPWIMFGMHFLTLFPLVLLLLLTYVSGRIVQRDERRAADELSGED